MAGRDKDVPVKHGIRIPRRKRKRKILEYTIAQEHNVDPKALQERKIRMFLTSGMCRSVSKSVRRLLGLVQKLRNK